MKCIRIFQISSQEINMLFFFFICAIIIFYFVVKIFVTYILVFTWGVKSYLHLTVISIHKIRNYLYIANFFLSIRDKTTFFKNRVQKIKYINFLTRYFTNANALDCYRFEIIKRNWDLWFSYLVLKPIFSFQLLYSNK